MKHIPDDVDLDSSVYNINVATEYLTVQCSFIAEDTHFRVTTTTYVRTQLLSKVENVQWQEMYSKQL